MSTNAYSPKFGPVAGGNFITFTSPTLDYTSFPPTGATVHGVACTGGTLLGPGSYRFTVPAEAFSDVARDVVLLAPFGATFPASYVYVVAADVAIQVSTVPGLIRTSTSTITTTVGHNPFTTFYQGGGTITWSKTAGPGTASFSPNVNDPNPTITFSVPGVYTIRADIANSIGTNFVTSTINIGAPIVISTLSTFTAPVAGGTAITITGSGFKGVASGGTGTNTATFAAIDLVNITSFVVVDDNHITGVIPAHSFSSSGKNVTVSDGTNISGLFGVFYYITTPVVDNGIVTPDLFSLATTALAANIKTTGAADFSSFFAAGGTVLWTSSAGSFSSPTTLNTNFTPPGRGSYTIRLTATNSLGTNFEETVLNFHSIPMVNAGADDVATTINGYDLKGSATDL